ncbi:translation initiation factor IF-3 [Candidatus Gottesmanbacteria bacterium RIFCSPHIGHO2_02_FULL_40_13]|uniref:Translation initiation factor IF-3 n=1 Tax=Candidatus Gottesmanbacteria bacterium RIFCSPHIGHO2_02_FULL_40_13 TaxID=1798384 RepID=A0A1F6A990_9BACT|nr:MAG: translation initiation factor IF-3 [Candidatus Gottesmanbacteria bacterium RIFCSPHIGHO2_02_FULL_40_13]
MRTKYYRLNYQISAPQIRLLDDKGKQIGIIDKNEALRRAKTEEKDLVEIAPNAKPPVVKLIDYKKFKYLEEKKKRESGKSVKNVGIKGIRLSPFIGTHDLQVRINQGKSFLEDGNQLKIMVAFKGRQIIHKNFGFDIMNKVVEALKEQSKVIKSPYFEGKVLASILSPYKKGADKNV